MPNEPRWQDDETPVHPGSRWGCGMYVAFWVALIVVLSLLFDVWVSRQHNPNTEPLAEVREGEFIEVVLTRNRDGHYVTSGRINGEPVTFMVDTGASDVAIPAAKAARLGLTRGPRQVYRTANGAVVGYVTTLERVSIGPLRLRQVRGSINTGMAPGDDVLLGMSFLRRVEMLQRGGQLRLRYTPSGRLPGQ